RGAEIRDRRIEELIRTLHEQARVIDESKVNLSFFKTEEWGDLLLRTMDGSARTRSEEKRRLYAAILLGAASTERPNDLDVEALLDSLSDLTEKDVLIAAEVYKTVHGDTAAFIDGLGVPDQPDAEFHIQRLRAAGLLVELDQTFFGGPRKYTVTDTFRR